VAAGGRGDDDGKPRTWDSVSYMLGKSVRGCMRGGDDDGKLRTWDSGSYMLS